LLLVFAVAKVDKDLIHKKVTQISNKVNKGFSDGCVYISESEQKKYRVKSVLKTNARMVRTRSSGKCSGQLAGSDQLRQEQQLRQQHQLPRPHRRLRTMATQTEGEPLLNRSLFPPDLSVELCTPSTSSRGRKRKNSDLASLANVRDLGPRAKKNRRVIMQKRFLDLNKRKLQIDDSSSSSSGDDSEDDEKDRVAFIHVGEGGEADLEARLKGADNLDVQILEEEQLPDIDESDMIHGLDHTGTARDYVDEAHNCTEACPDGCRGTLRPNEIVIYESYKWRGKLKGRKR